MTLNFVVREEMLRKDIIKSKGYNKLFNYTIHLVGAQKSNYPWGFENRLIPVFKELGYHVISTDFRQERKNLSELLIQPADLVLVCKGDGISPELIHLIKCPTVLWWAELLGTLKHVDEMALERRKILAYNVSAFDIVFVHDEANIPVCQKLGGLRVQFLPTAAVDPYIHRRLNVEKIYDIGFVGEITPRRKEFLSRLQKHFRVEIRNIWDPIELNQFFNETKIVLNIHLSKLLNTETRLCEVLGSGSFLLSEEISSPNLFQEGKHLIYWKQNDLDDLVDKIEFYLNHDEERERIASEGHIFVHAHHTIKHRIEQLMNVVQNIENQKYWSNNILGVLYDAEGREINNIEFFYNATRGKISDTEYALAWANKRIHHSGWYVSQRALRLLVSNLPKDIERVVEFGAGFSTLFLIKLFALRSKPLKITSFEHQKEFYYYLANHITNFNGINLILAELKQLTDIEYENLFSTDNAISEYRIMGQPVPKKIYSATRLQNVFYDLDLSELIKGKIDLFILDGPNGNGRSIVFPLIKQIVKPPFYFLIDDITHHPYLEQMSRIFYFKKIFEENFGHDSYCFVEVIDVK